jgi:predicted nucleic acid-binding protein
MMRALIDTGAIYAFTAVGDWHHQEAAQFMRNWIKRDGVFFLSDLVFIETMTLTKRRLGSEVAIRLGSELRENPVFFWISLSPALELETWAAFRSYNDKDWSYTDCALLVLAGKLKIPGVFSFDNHFGQMPGIRRLPS